jgi:universal stress protein A
VGSPVQAAEVRKELEQNVLHQLEALAHEGDETKVLVGKAAEMILSYAETWQPDLIVMGTHGRTRLAHFLNGSVAETVVRHAQLPVLIVHEKKD